MQSTHRVLKNTETFSTKSINYGENVYLSGEGILRLLLASRVPMIMRVEGSSPLSAGIRTRAYRWSSVLVDRNALMFRPTKRKLSASVVDSGIIARTENIQCAIGKGIASQALRKPFAVTGFSSP